MYVKTKIDSAYSTGLDMPHKIRASVSGSAAWPVDVIVNGDMGEEVHMAFTPTEAEEVARSILAALELDAAVAA